MQDRFKFRIWSAINQIMSYEICFGNFFQKNKTEKEVFDWVSVSYGNDSFISYRNTMLDNLKLMQCTGFKDKNGKLIYEGDIVYKKGSKNWKKEKLYSIVIYDNMYGHFNISDENGIHNIPQNKDNIEVIGNIYENPELLK